MRLVPRFVTDAELAGVLRRADLVTLPYREIDQSGVLYAALGLGRPLLLSDVGGFGEVAATGAAELVAPGDPAALHAALAALLADPDRRATLALAATHAAAARPTPGTRSPSAISRSTRRCARASRARAYAAAMRRPCGMLTRS